MFKDLITKRQSARSYLPTPVAREDILKCLEAAQKAPSACNSQPWHFIIVDDPDLKTKLASALFSGPYVMNAFACQAPVLAIVVSEKSSFMAKIGGYFRGTEFYLLDIGAAIEHFILAAAELGLSSCWLGWFNEASAKKILNIPKDRKIDSVISLGFSNETLREKIRKPLEEISSFNSYGMKEKR
jgi:nitroreductase